MGKVVFVDMDTESERKKKEIVNVRRERNANCVLSIDKKLN